MCLYPFRTVRKQRDLNEVHTEMNNIFTSSLRKTDQFLFRSQSIIIGDSYGKGQLLLFTVGLT